MYQPYTYETDVRYEIEIPVGCACGTCTYADAVVDATNTAELVSAPAPCVECGAVVTPENIDAALRAMTCDSEANYLAEQFEASEFAWFAAAHSYARA